MVELNKKINKLEKLIETYEKVVVGFSAGVDSTLVSYVSNKMLGKNALIVLAHTETIIEEDVLLARDIADKYNFNYKEIEYSELEIDNYAKNPVNRCYFCKRELYSHLNKIANRIGARFILDGANLMDLRDYRPGRMAAEESKIKSPLIECEFTKNDVREAAKLYGLPNHDKPSAPCLSSRIPYGTPIDKNAIKMIAEGEKFLRKFGFKNIRVRHFGNVARIEVDNDLIPILYQNYDKIKEQFQFIGYQQIEIDEEGFKSGKLNNQIIKQIEIIK